MTKNALVAANSLAVRAFAVSISRWRRNTRDHEEPLKKERKLHLSRIPEKSEAHICPVLDDLGMSGMVAPLKL